MFITSKVTFLSAVWGSSPSFKSKVTSPPARVAWFVKPIIFLLYGHRSFLGIFIWLNHLRNRMSVELPVSTRMHFVWNLLAIRAEITKGSSWLGFDEIPSR